MLDQNEMKYFVYFEDIFSFCIFAIYERTHIKGKTGQEKHGKSEDANGSSALLYFQVKFWVQELKRST